MPQSIGRSRSSALLSAFTVASLTLAACASAASPSPSATAPSTVVPPSASATRPPGGLGSFTTSIPPAAETAWSGLDWRELGAADPLRQIRSIVRWSSGFVAVGVPVIDGASSRTPVWASRDGGTWQALDPAVLGPATVVLAVRAGAGGLVALTLQGGRSSCTDADLAVLGLDCLTLTPPLQSWTSADGEHWLAHPGPALPLPGEYGGESGRLDRPILVSGRPGFVVAVWERAVADASSAIVLAKAIREAPPAPGREFATQAQGVCRLAHSADGVTWETPPDGGFMARFVCSDIAPLDVGFAAIGFASDGRASALWSADGLHWAATSDLVAPASAAKAGVITQRFVTAARGLVALGHTAEVPGLSLWWSSTDGRAWQALVDYPPLGTWQGPGEGAGLEADGDLIGDGERMTAIRGGSHAAGWTSFDGRSWQALAIGALPADWGARSLLIATPAGILWVGQDGSVWFGAPGTS